MIKDKIENHAIELHAEWTDNFTSAIFYMHHQTIWSIIVDFRTLLQSSSLHFYESILKLLKYTKLRQQYNISFAYANNDIMYY